MPLQGFNTLCTKHPALISRSLRSTSFTALLAHRAHNGDQLQDRRVRLRACTSANLNDEPFKRRP
jgi:hypothetical protein